MSWTAIVPLKAAAERKTRLAGAMEAAAQAELANDMAGHVVATLASVAAIGTILVLSPAPEPIPGVVWEPDRGEGLNRELDRVCAALHGQRLLIIHADLPLVTDEDIAALLAAAEQAGAAIAPDRHGKGTNALALRDAAPVGFAFGANSFARHRERLPDAAAVRREGLAIDIDTAADITAAQIALPSRSLPLGRW